MLAWFVLKRDSQHLCAFVDQCLGSVDLLLGFREFSPPRRKRLLGFLELRQRIRTPLVSYLLHARIPFER